MTPPGDKVRRRQFSSISSLAAFADPEVPGRLPIGMEITLSRLNLPFAVFLLCSLWLTGCQKGPQVASVTGKVMLDGAPLPNATLTFTPEAGGRSSLGRTDESGVYQMLYAAGKDGAIVGEMRVRITTAEERQDASGDRSFMTKELLPKKYNTESELVVTVERKPNVIDFDLQSN